ncbi:hypothetical protein, partial [Mesomycoplasma ovipneumoniae]|uniref:hypothetical protein n=1 Tax=Mesomycoplasma ovipneumoniae TaxID=29562 RepID=UPI0030804303
SKAEIKVLDVPVVNSKITTKDTIKASVVTKTDTLKQVPAITNIAIQKSSVKTTTTTSTISKKEAFKEFFCQDSRLDLDYDRVKAHCDYLIDTVSKLQNRTKEFKDDWKVFLEILPETLKDSFVTRDDDAACMMRQFSYIDINKLLGSYRHDKRRSAAIFYNIVDFGQKAEIDVDVENKTLFVKNN